MKVTFDQTESTDDIFFRGNILISKSVQDHITIVMVTGVGRERTEFIATELYHSRTHAATPGAHSEFWAKDAFVQFTGQLTMEA